MYFVHPNSFRTSTVARGSNTGTELVSISSIDTRKKDYKRSQMVRQFGVQGWIIKQ